MKRHGLWMVLMTSLLVGPSIDVFAQQEGEASPSVRQGSRARVGDHGIVRGRVQAVHAPRLFTVEDRLGPGRDVLVVAPDARATPAVGAGEGLGAAVGVGDGVATVGVVAAGGVGTFARGAFEQATAATAIASAKRCRGVRTAGTIDGARKGHGDAWLRQGRRTDRCEPRNAVPPR